MEFDRRMFLAGAGTTLAAFAQTPKIATAMIGTGNRGSYVMKGVMEQPEAQIAALCDIKPDRLDAAASVAAAHKPKTYRNWQEVIDRKDIEAVYIATPPDLHADMAVAALQAGKHVYCEKPIGVTAYQVRDVVRAARRSNKVFMAGQQLRSHKQLGEAVSKIHSGEIGNVLMVKAQRHAPTDLAHDGSSGDWYFNVAKSGGYLIEQSVHNLDVCNWVIGAHPIRAVGFGATNLYKNDPPGRDIFDCSVITYDYPNGVKMSFTQNVFHPRTMPTGGQYVFVYGSKAAVDLMYAATKYPLDRDGQPSIIANKQEEYAHQHTRAFFDAITKGATPVAGIEIGATAALTAILGHEAMVREKVVTWSDLGVDI